MKKAFDNLPPADYLLYEKIHLLIEKNVKDQNLTDHQKQILEQKVLYTIQTLSLYFYGMPIFRDVFQAYRQGPIIEKIYDIQIGKKGITKKPKKLDLDNLEYYKMVSDELVDIMENAIEKKLYPLNSNILSDLTHTPEWNAKYNKRESEPIVGRKNKVGEMTDKDMLKFYTALIDQYPDFTNYVEQQLWKVDNA
ncbi:MAG: type II toxin-antitoxin system antitoxin SocA domain-containing protein [Brevinema sp.]